MLEIYETDLERKLFLSFVRLHILYHAVEKEVYGLEIITGLEKHSYKISPGTLYPILHNMEKIGYLKSKKELVNGKIRRYYKATTRGKSLLDRAKEKVKELSIELVEEK